jgi:hypothetical protein
MVTLSKRLKKRIVLWVHLTQKTHCERSIAARHLIRLAVRRSLR